MSAEAGEPPLADAVAAAQASGDPLDVALAALQVVTSIESQLTGISDKLDTYAVYGKRSRHIIIALAISLAFDIAITAVVGVVAASAHSTVSELHAASLSQCVAGNQFRSDQNTIWAGFVGLLATPEPGESAADKRKTAAEASTFLKFVRTVNSLRDCAAVYGPGT